MELKNVAVLKFVSERKINSKNGKELVFVKVADPVSYENFDFIADRDYVQGRFATGDDVSLSLTISGGNRTFLSANLERYK